MVFCGNTLLSHSWSSKRKQQREFVSSTHRKRRRCLLPFLNNQTFYSKWNHTNIYTFITLVLFRESPFCLCGKSPWARLLPKSYHGPSPGLLPLSLPSHGVRCALKRALQACSTQPLSGFSVSSRVPWSSTLCTHFCHPMQQSFMGHDLPLHRWGWKTHIYWEILGNTVCSH